MAYQPTYDFLAGAAPSPERRQPLRETPKPPPGSRADINNENLRAQLNTLQYELATLKQDKEFIALQHQQEVRDAQNRAEADYKRAQAAEAASTAAKSRADALAREQQEAQDRAVNQRTQFEKRIRGLQDEKRLMREELEEAQEALAGQARQHKRAYEELEAKHATLKASVEGIQEDLNAKVNALHSTQQKLAKREAEAGELENEVLRLKAQAGDSDTLAVIKKELSEQVAYIKRLEAANREHMAELKQYRKMQKSIDVVEEEKRSLEARVRMMDDLRRELAEARLQRRILEDEKKGWTSYLESEMGGEDGMKYDTPEQMARAFLQERLERLSLVDKLGSLQPELAVKEGNLRALEDEKARLQAELVEVQSAAASAGDSKVRIRLERQKNLLAKEVEYLRAQMKAFEAEEAEFSPEKADEERMKRIHELEDMVEQYRSELESARLELSRLESSQPQMTQSPRKRPHEDEADHERLGELQRKVRILQTVLDKLQTRNQFLEAELKASVVQISSLKETSRTRALELRNNPTAQVEAIKMTTLRTLQDENAALLAQLEGRPNGTKVVPISTLDAVRLQLEHAKTQIAQHEKKTMRLKQIWGSKALEFREAVCSILGWNLEFMPNGRVKATSILYPETVLQDGEKEENSIVFDGENGTMKVSGGPQSVFAGEIRSLIEFWVEGRKEIPCFLAACTLEFYDKTTRAARA